MLPVPGWGGWFVAMRVMSMSLRLVGDWNTTIVNKITRRSLDVLLLFPGGILCCTMQAGLNCCEGLSPHYIKWQEHCDSTYEHVPFCSSTLLCPCADELVWWPWVTCPCPSETDTPQSSPTLVNISMFIKKIATTTDKQDTFLFSFSFLLPVSGWNFVAVSLVTVSLGNMGNCHTAITANINKRYINST